MSDAIEYVKIFGAIAGIAALTWNIWSAVRAYLLLTFKIDKPENGISLLSMSVSNSSGISKRISYSAVVVSPENWTIDDVANVLAGNTPTSGRPVNALMRLYRARTTSPVYQDNCALLPLPELSREQALLGPNETIGHACSLDARKLAGGTTYIARFIIYLSYARIYVRWRYTSSAFFLTGDGHEKPMSFD